MNKSILPVQSFVADAPTKKTYVAMDPLRAQRLEKLSDRYLVSTAEGFADLAIDLLDWALKETSSGRRIVSADPTMVDPKFRSCGLELLELIGSMGCVG